MANIKHHFRRGRMNKDLDERLLPNGEYRDAQNIEIVTSEGSDVGSIQNVLGTVLKKGRTYDENTQVLTEWSADSNLFDLIDPTCIGSFVDTQNDNIYWFIHYSFLNTAGDAITNGSAVVEYEDSTGVIQPILVDVNDILNFSSNYLITGINIIDGLLFWTDNQTEPKRINIKKFKEGTTVGSDQFKVQTKYLGSTGSNFTEKDITVIKLSPNVKPELTLSASKRTGAGTGNEPITIKSHSISFRTSNDADGVARPSGTELFLQFPIAPNYKVGDILKLSLTEKDSIEGDTEYEIRAKITKGTNSFLTTFIKILTIPENIPYGTTNDSGAFISEYSVVLVEEDPLFEDKFVRFSYRWKYIDGEYSTFAPFSNVAFVPSNFEYKSSDGFNVGMSNTARQIKIQTLETPPVGVIEVDLLYKESNNNNIYIVDRIKTEDLSTEFPYEIKSEIVGDVVESNQILRPWDNVPLKAQAQELSSNRILYGNYTQGYNIENNRLPDIITTHNSTDITTVEAPEKSVKSQRTYQVGVVYLDPYSRETPVFSKKEAAVQISKEHANKVNSLSCKLNNNAPEFATHFKHFIKESSSEYYNIALDRYYLAEDGNIWLSFPSSERNKVTEEDYLILKKKHNESVFVEEEAKYKILDIKNEVPDFISQQLISKATANVQARYDSGLESEPTVGAISFQFEGPTDVLNPSFYNSFSSDSEIAITTLQGSNEVATTQRYKIQKGGPTGTQNSSLEIYEVTLKSPIKEADKDVFAVYNTDGTASSSYLLNTAQNAVVEFKIEVLQKEKKIDSQFFGRFFVKINRDSIFDSSIIETFPAVQTEFASIRSEQILENALSDPENDNNNSIPPAAALAISSGVPAILVLGFAVASWNSKPKKDKNVDWCWTDTNPKSTYDKGEHQHPKRGSKNFVLYLAGVDLPGDKHDPDEKFQDIITNPMSRDLRQVGNFIQFENAKGLKGSIYKITKSEVTTDFRSKKRSLRKRTVGRRRNFNIEIEKVTQDTSRNKGYDDPFVYEDASDTSDTGRIAKIHIVRKLVSTDFLDENDMSSNNPAVFEVEPKESIDLDIYNEVGSAVPILKTGLQVTGTNIAANSVIDLYDTIENTIILNNNTTGSIPTGTVLTFTDPKGIYSFTLTTTGTISSGTANITIADSQVHGQDHQLDWFNCYSFGQGVESNRIRDDFNAVIIDKGPIVSTVLNEKYQQEIKLNTIIYSGIFNATGGVNRLNEFIQAEKITKDLNPEYGSIQKLHTRDADVIAFCEDKVIKILANKDALFNADGNTNLTSTNNVLGQAMPYSGEYGISKNPESFVSHAYRVYFSDKARGSVLRLSRDGITDIAIKGMTDWFNDNLPLSTSIVGSYNERKGSYNITLNNYTLCFDERVDGWTSFKSFLPESGVSLNNTYYTYKNGYLYAHTNERRNSFHQVLAKTAAALTNGTSLSIATQPGVDNIAIGDYVLGTGVAGDVTVTNISVPTTTVGGVTIPNRSINTTVTLSSNQTISDSTNLEFIKTSDTSVTLLINDESSTIKEYKTLNYEGSDSKSFTYSGTISVDASGSSLSPNVTIGAGTTLAELQKSNYNSNQIAQLTETSAVGWSAESVTTNSQSGSVKLFKNKEGLWSNIILGDTTSLSNIDTKELSVQGLGSFSSISGAASPTQAELTIVLANSTTDHNTDVSATKIITGVANGANLNSVYGTLDLTIAPNTGYNISASSFAFSSASGVSGAGVSSISFTQDGVNVKATITFSGVMPSSDDEMTVNITGAASANTYTLAGTYDTIEENTTTASSDNIAYSGTGTYNATAATVFTKTFVADDNYSFSTKPTAFIEEEDTSAISSYTITDDWATTTATVNGAVTSSNEVTLDGGHTSIVNGMAVAGVGLGQDARVHSIGGNTLILTSAKTIPDGTTLTFTSTSVTFTVKYVYGINNPKFDKLIFTAKSTEIFSPNTAELTAFDGGNKTIIAAGETKTMVIQGSTGYADETNPTFTFSNEAEGSGTITFSQSSTSAATLSFTTLVGSPQDDMIVYSGNNLPGLDNGSGGTVAGSTKISTISVNKFTGVRTLNLVFTGNSDGSLSAPTGTVKFRNFYNSATGLFQSDSYTLTLPDTGRLSISKEYGEISVSTYYRYFIRAVAPADLSSSFSGNATLDSSNDFASCEVNQYADPLIYINAHPDEAFTAKVNGAVSSSSTLNIDEVGGDIKIGDIITGTGISGTVTVASITSLTRLEMSSNQSLSDNVLLTFTRPIITDSDGAQINIRNLDSTVTVGTATAKVNVGGGTSASTAVVVDNNSGTIQAGFFVTGSGISGTVTVESLSDQQNLVLSSNQTIADNVDLTFSGASANSKTIILQAANANIKTGMLIKGTNMPVDGDGDPITRVVKPPKTGTTMTIDQFPTTAPTGELKFLDSGKYYAYGDPDADSNFSQIPFKVVASVGGSTTLTKQRDIIIEDDFQYVEAKILANTVIADTSATPNAVGLSGTVAPDSIGVGSIVTSDRITENYPNKIITVTQAPVPGVYSAAGNIYVLIAEDGVAVSDATDYVTSGDELTFSSPYGWDIAISNLEDAITGSSKIYTLTGLLSVSRYGYQKLPITLDLNNILSQSSGSGGTTATYVFIQKTFSTDTHISGLVMYPKSVAVGTGTSTNIVFTGTVTGNWYGNTMSGVRLYLGPATAGFKDSSGGVLTTGTSGDVSVSLTSTLTTANSSPTVTQATFTFTLRLAAVAATGQTLIVEPRISLPIEP